MTKITIYDNLNLDMQLINQTVSIREKAFSFLEEVRAQNRNVDFNQAYEDITAEVVVMRKQYARTSNRNRH